MVKRNLIQNIFTLYKTVCRDEMVRERTQNSTRLALLERRLAEISSDVEKSIRVISDDVQLKVSLFTINVKVNLFI